MIVVARTKNKAACEGSLPSSHPLLNSVAVVLRVCDPKPGVRVKARASRYRRLMPPAPMSCSGSRKIFASCCRCSSRCVRACSPGHAHRDDRYGTTDVYGRPKFMTCCSWACRQNHWFWLVDGPSVWLLVDWLVNVLIGWLRSGVLDLIDLMLHA